MSAMEYSAGSNAVQQHPATSSYVGPLYLRFLKINGWTSDLPAVQNLLNHLSRKSKSEGTKKNYSWHLYGLCRTSGKAPDELVKLRRDVAEKLVQSYTDTIAVDSPRYGNMAIYALRAFFHSNGYRHSKELELESYHVPRRFRVTPEYVPSKIEVYAMADSAGSLRDRAIILALYSSGLRNSTIRALQLKHIVNEAKDSKIINILLPVCPEMKKRVSGACKCNITYYSFLSEEASKAIRLYLKEREAKYGPFNGDEPLFNSECRRDARTQRTSTLMSARELQIIVKMAAKKAGLENWEAVHPHCLRKAFETVLHTNLIDGTNMDVKVQEVFMGHTLPGSQDNYFDRSKVQWMRIQYSKLRFARPTVENKFNLLRSAVARAFEDTGIDPDAVIEEYVNQKQSRVLG
jgi:integrase